MNLTIKGTRYEPTPDIIEQANRQIERIAKMLPDTALAHLDLELAVGNQNAGDIWRAVLTVTSDGTYRAESTKAKLDHAVTTVMRDVAREVSRAKGKGKSLLHRSGNAFKNLLRGFDR
ncbi:MAG TPA: HPF/RaiA family ribosome-associated protein [Candidatus Paceibacterota bacterium]|nr:HPF/RaiA family ribosome-associated protein [Candidatus Paceibacterota bacterium]